MLIMTNPTGLSTISQSLIGMADKDEVSGSESGSNKTNLSNPFVLKRSIEGCYLTFKGAKKGGNNLKKGGNNTKKSARAGRGSDYLTPDAKKTFNYLLHAFIQVSILQYFDLERQIRIETNTLNYAISKVMSQLTLDELGRWHQVAYYSDKIIPAKTRYKFHNGKLLPIVKTFKTWWYYLKDCKYKVFILTN